MALWAGAYAFLRSVGTVYKYYTNDTYLWVAQTLTK